MGYFFIPSCFATIFCNVWLFATKFAARITVFKVDFGNLKFLFLFFLRNFSASLTALSNLILLLDNLIILSKYEIYVYSTSLLVLTTLLKYIRGFEIKNEIFRKYFFRMDVYVEVVTCGFDAVTIEKLMFLEHEMEHMIELESLLKSNIDSKQ